jgi:hypothetical protein
LPLRLKNQKNRNKIMVQRENFSKFAGKFNQNFITMEIEPIQNKIYEIRGYRVMLDFDLAKLYGIETKMLKRQVRRNIERFEGEDFMFELTPEELSRCHFGTLNSSRGSNIKYRPFAFTEIGVAMLSSVLNSPTAIDANRSIMRAFVYIRQMLANRPIDETMQLQNEVRALKQYVDDVFTTQHNLNAETRLQLEQINQTLTELQSTRALPMRPRRRIGFSLGGVEEMIE